MSRGRRPQVVAAFGNAVARVVQSLLHPLSQSQSHAGVMSRSASIEMLEPRKLMTTLVGGDTFDYLDAEDNVIRIRLIGDIEAEFTAVRIRESDNSQVVRDLIQAPPPDSDIEADGADLFNIYIARADIDSQIIITEVSDPLRLDRGATPYGGGFGNLQVTDSIVGGPLIDVTPGFGSVYIGARTVDLESIDGDEEADIPIAFSSRRSAFGIRPASRGIYAGIETAEGVSVGRILIGGTITGRVFIDGSIDTLYAGNILTGSVNGLFTNSASDLVRNIFVAGDFRNLLVSGSIGGVQGENYYTGAEMRIGGRLGNVKVGQLMDAAVSVIANPSIGNPLVTPMREVEYRLSPGETAGSAFLNGDLSLELFQNDTAGGAQFGYTYESPLTEQSDTLEFAGTVQRGEGADRFGLALIAGQTIQIDLNAPLGGLLLGLYDPYGRVVASDAIDQGEGGANEAFRYTAKLPGVYTLQVTVPDAGPGGAIDFDAPGIVVQPVLEYQLEITRANTVSLGGIDVGGDYNLTGPRSGITVRVGDLGALRADGTVSRRASDTAGFTLTPPAISVSKGNLRTIDSGSIGGVDLVVPRGSVGLLRTSGDNSINPSGTINVDDPDPDAAIGFDYQRIDVGGTFEGNIIANRALGTLRAGSVAGRSGGVGGFVAAGPRIAVNVDEIGQDGTIDLIDVTGDFGALVGGGPGISTGFGGNVKYMRVGGVTYRDRFFGSAAQTEFTGRPGQVLTYTDDSGALARLIPTTIVGAAAPGTGGTPGAPVTTNGFLTVVTYPIRGSSGVAVVSIESSTNVNIAVAGDRGSFDVASIIARGDGTATSYLPVARTVGFAAGRNPLGTEGATSVFQLPQVENSSTFSGRLPINVLDIRNWVIMPSNILDVTNIINSSPGEIVGIQASSIGNLVAQKIGYSEVNTPAELLLENNFVAGGKLVYPFTTNSFGIYTEGSIISLRSREAIGTVIASDIAGAGQIHGARIGTIVANTDGRNRRGVFEGIIGNVFSQGFNRIEIGEGIPTQGTGSFSQAGIFAAIDPLDTTPTPGQRGEIRQIIGNNADIRGMIFADDQIDSIQLTNGSLINATVLIATNVNQARYLQGGLVLTDAQTEPNSGSLPGVQTHYNLGLLNVTNGGILGSRIAVGDFNTIRVDEGFGILGSNIISVAQFNANGSVITDGFGIRNSTIGAGASLNLVDVQGDGSTLDVRTWGRSVTQSERRQRFDPSTGRLLISTNDLHRFFGTSRTRSSIDGRTDSGIFADSEILGSGDLGTVQAYAIRATNTNTPPASPVFPTRIAFASSTNRIRVTGSVSGLYVSTGRLNQFRVGKNLQQANLQIAGRTREISIGRNVRGNVGINISGPEGYLDRLRVGRGFYGTLAVNRDTGNLNFGSFGGRVQGGTPTTTSNIRNITVSGDILSGSYIRVFGRMNTLTVGDDVESDTFIRSSRQLGTLTIGGDVQAGATIRARSIAVRNIAGTVSGSIRTP
jgi:hypothetical protein